MDLSDLNEKFKAFSEAGVRKHSERDLMLYGLGLWSMNWPIVEDAANVWLTDEDLAHLRKMNWNLGMVVGAVVANQTRDGFSWPIVTKILETSKISMASIHFIIQEYPLALNKFSSIYDLESFHCLDMKNLCQTLAKCALFMETVTFLDSEGYGELLKN